MPIMLGRGAPRTVQRVQQSGTFGSGPQLGKPLQGGPATSFRGGGPAVAQAPAPAPKAAPATPQGIVGLGRR